MRFMLFISGCALIALSVQPSISGVLLCMVMMLCLGLSIPHLHNTKFLKRQNTTVLLISTVIWMVLAMLFVVRWRSKLLHRDLPELIAVNIDCILCILAIISSISILFIAVCVKFLGSETIQFGGIQDKTIFQGQGSKMGLLPVSALMLIAGVVICMQSPNNIFSYGMSKTDSSVFQYIGWLMTKGYIPYRDAFDHKGLLTYFINYIGMLLSFDYGIWIVELVFMLITIAISYRLARLFAGTKKSLMAVFFAFTLFAVYFEGGNFTEEWALPFILTAVYVFMLYFIYRKFSGIGFFLCGSSFACVFLLRANMIAVWIVFCCMFLIHCIRERAWKYLSKAMGYFILGILVVGIPTVVYLCQNHAWSQFIEDYLLFNVIYSGNEGWEKRILAMMDFALTPQFLFGVIIVILMMRRSEKEEKYINTGYLILLFVAVAMVAMSGRRYGHYGMVLIPLLIYPYSSFMERIPLKEVLDKYGGKKFGNMVKKSIYICMVVLSMGILIVGVRVNRRIDMDLEQVVRCIDNMADRNEEIIVFGNECLVYLKAQRHASSKYFYQKPIASIDKKIADDFVYELEMNLPRIVIACATLDDYEKNFLKNYDYDVASKYGTYTVYRLPDAEGKTGLY